MSRNERYREAARRLLAQRVAIVTVDDTADVQVLNAGIDREAVGTGAFVEARVWVPVEALASR